MSRLEFKTRLVAEGEGGAWTILKVPFAVEKVWGTRARLAVKGTLNGFAFRSSLFPMGGGTHGMMINKQMQAGAGAGPGDTVSVVMEPDAAPRVVEVPPDLKKALAKNKAARAAFEAMPPSHKKEYVDAIVEAKKPETRARRIKGALKMMVEWGQRRAARRKK